MPLTRFFLRHIFAKNKRKSLGANIPKTTPAGKLIFFAKDGEGKSLQKQGKKKIAKFSMLPFRSTR